MIDSSVGASVTIRSFLRFDNRLLAQPPLPYRAVSDTTLTVLNITCIQAIGRRIMILLILIFVSPTFAAYGRSTTSAKEPFLPTQNSVKLLTKEHLLLKRVSRCEAGERLWAS